MPFGGNYRKTRRSGCFGGFGRGCSSIIFFFIVLIYLLSSIDFPEFDFDLGGVQPVSYNIHMDSLTTENIVNASYSWKFVSNGLEKKKYNLTFTLVTGQVKNAMDLIDRIGNMSLEELGLNPNYDYRNPQIQAQYVWARVYRIVYEKSFPTIISIAQGFNQIFTSENLIGIDRVSFIISFVQNMKYDRPGGILDLLAPLGTLAKQYGDCDTKAILLYVLLEKLGVDCAMMWSYKYKHALLGINISARGDYKRLNGKKYYFLETTYPGWSIGNLPPEFKNKSYWIIDEIDSRSHFKKYKDYKKENQTDRKTKPSPANP